MNLLQIRQNVIYDQPCVNGEYIKSRYVTVIVINSGSGNISIDDETEECNKGDVFVLKSEVSYYISPKDESVFPTALIIEFDANDWLKGEWADEKNLNFCYGIFRENKNVAYTVLNSEMLGRVKTLCSDILSELQQKRIGWQDAAASTFTMLLISLARYIDMADTIEPSKRDHNVSAAIKYVQKNYHNSNITLGAVADSLFISKSHLSRKFREVMGESFPCYVKNVRINKACELLCHTGLTNIEIIEVCGFTDVQSFYRLFKETLGMTPYQYRMSKNVYKKGVKYMSIVNEISENLQKGKAKIVKELVEKALAEGVPAAQILDEGLLAGMNVIGEKFKTNEVYVPEVLVAARAMNMGTQVLKPYLKDDVTAVGKVCIGTVEGDLHDIGKNLVKMMMEGKGLEVVDLGVDVSPQAFVDTAINENCDVICCSALLTTTMNVMAEVVKLAEEKGIRDKVKILVGGAPVTDEFCKKIGADKYTSDAASAADAAVEFCRK